LNELQHVLGSLGSFCPFAHTRFIEQTRITRSILNGDNGKMHAMIAKDVETMRSVPLLPRAIKRWQRRRQRCWRLNGSFLFISLLVFFFLWFLKRFFGFS